MGNTRCCGVEHVGVQDVVVALPLGTLSKPYMAYMTNLVMYASLDNVSRRDNHAFTQ